VLRAFVFAFCERCRRDTVQDSNFEVLVPPDHPCKLALGLKRRFIGRGMHWEFRHPDYSTPIVTSTIQEIHELPQCKASEIAALA